MRARETAAREGERVGAPRLTESPSDGLGPRARVYDRIVRIVSSVVIAAIVISIVVGNLWPDTNAAIFVVLGAMMLFLVLVQDVIPPTLLGRRRFVLEGVVGVVFVTALVVLTGGSMSPFFFGYFLIVAGTALWIRGRTLTALVGFTALMYLAGLIVGPLALGGENIAPLPSVAFNLLALGLMAFLAHVAGREQRRISERALKLSRYDDLTQLLFRAYFLELMDREIRRAVRTGRGFCLLMLDLDDLKPINDTFGHPFGDRMLRAVADIVRREIRASDAAARYGGDEFIILLPETETSGALVLAEKLRADIGHIGFRVADRNLGISVSIGLASFPSDGNTIDELIQVVDQAMYEAKHRGKNRIAYRDLTADEDGSSGAGGRAAEAAPALRSVGGDTDSDGRAVAWMHAPGPGTSPGAPGMAGSTPQAGVRGSATWSPDDRATDFIGPLSGGTRPADVAFGEPSGDGLSATPPRVPRSPRPGVPLFGPGGSPGQPMPDVPRRTEAQDRRPGTRHGPPELRVFQARTQPDGLPSIPPQAGPTNGPQSPGPSGPRPRPGPQPADRSP